MDPEYKDNSIRDKTLRFLYQNDLFNCNFGSEDTQIVQDDLELNDVREIITLLIELQIPPISRMDKHKCQEAHANIIRLTNIFFKHPNQVDEIVQTINEVISQSQLKEFHCLINEYIYSDIPPCILVEILHLIYTIMICPKSFFIPLLNDKIIDLLVNIIDEPKSGIHIFPDLDFSEEEEENEIIDEYNPFLEGFDKTSEANARTYSSLILTNFFELYVQMNEEEKNEIGLPEFEPLFTHLINGIYKTTRFGQESYASNPILFLLLFITQNFSDQFQTIQDDTFMHTFITLISCAKNPFLNGVEYALRLLFIFNSEGYIANCEDIYSKEDFDEIFSAAANSNQDYHWELTALIHSVFFSGNESALRAIMESLESTKAFDFIGYLKYCSEIKDTLYFCKMCKDLLHLLFLRDYKYSIPPNEFMQFFDRIGLIELLVKIAYESKFNLKREAVSAISTTCYNFDINLMRKLIEDLNFIELLTPFITLDFQILQSTTLFVYKVLTIVSKLQDEDARGLLSRLLNAKIFDEMEDSIQQFDLPDPRLKYDNENQKNNEEEEEEEEAKDISADDAEKSFNAKLSLSDELLRVINLKNEQCERLFQNE